VSFVALEARCRRVDIGDTLGTEIRRRCRRGRVEV
jgi:hypothetical protein